MNFLEEIYLKKMTTQNNYEIENAYTIKLKKDKDVIRYIYKTVKFTKTLIKR